ncbi:MAG: 16S rRNA (guanine(966)-N(2))-methyltransferase RsmD [Holdemanella sp.]|nr:16S rRNA (guanine(966)-N(2))-methyltransferase RsmD [Holdemanella sp.]
MRVISGSAKGHKLNAPEGLHTRPITDQIKQALFNSWQFMIRGCDFLDLFSGSGSMGIEAMSRGARYTVMVDNDTTAITVIQGNIKACKLNACNHKVCKEDVFASIARMVSNKETFDIIYLDPPFTVESIFHPVMEALSDGKLLKEDGLIAIRTPKELELNDEYGVLIRYKQKKYGISMMHFYEVKK